MEIAERFYLAGDRESLVERMSVAAKTDAGRLSDFERDWVRSLLDL
jgi:hypothetical protein